MERQCLQCETPFTLSHRRKYYCSETCVEMARTWVCAGCSAIKKARFPSQKKTYCADCCARQRGFLARTFFQETRDRQVAQGRVLVVCTYDKCPRPEDLLDRTRSESKHPSLCRHPECKIALREDRHGGNRPLAGREAFCTGCGRPRGHLRPSYARKFKHCRACAVRIREAGKIQPESPATLVADDQVHELKEWRACGLVGCDSGRLVYVSEIRKYPNRTFYCSRPHFKAATAMRVPRVHCRACGRERALERAHIPQTFDPETMTYLCQACRPTRSLVRMFTCHRAGCSTLFERRVSVNAPDIPRFCSLTCHVLHYDGGRALCANSRCYNPIPRRKLHNRYCGVACYQIAERGQPNPHHQPSKAEQAVLLQWERGERGVRNLATASGVARNTVRRVLREHALA